MLSRRLVAAVAAVLAAGALAALPGCDWLKGSESGQRQDPFLSSLSVSPASVFCDDPFSISFRYDDPQGDIVFARVTLQLVGGTESIEKGVVWPEDLKSKYSGTVTFDDFSFECDAHNKGGTWSVSVQADDERENESNVLTGQIRLTAPG
jgi:hypothetical protein